MGYEPSYVIEEFTMGRRWEIKRFLLGLINRILHLV